ncbi:MAG: DUF456 domain-containing protein [Anaerolineales bacterium]|nr:DUF456 domain-containing protein [Anaerolineales bacterium]
MPEWLQLLPQVIFETIILAVLLVGLVSLIVPVFPGLTIMWFLGILPYTIVRAIQGNMTGWEWFAFVFTTLLMIGGNIVDNLIIAKKVRENNTPWSSILIAFAAGIVVSVFFTPLVGLIAAPLGLFLAELGRLKDRDEALQSTKAYMIGWGWAFGARFLIGITMIGSWMLWAWL